MKRLVVMAAIAGSSMSSSPARACDPVGAQPERLIVPFADAVVPRNATLEVFNTFLAGVNTVVVDGPEGEQRLRFGDDGRTLPPTTLLVGAHTVTISTLDGVRTFAFEVEDRIDDDAPALRAEVHRESDRFAVEPCSPGIPSLTPVHGVSFIDDVDATHVVLSSPETAWAVDAGVAHVGGELPTLTVVDLAGNRSAVEIIDSGGCASMPASTSLLAALLLFVRRRRNA